MNGPDQIERERHRLIILRRKGSEILHSSNGFDWSLPCVEILPRHRVAEQLTAELHSQSGLRAYCLFDLSPNGSDREPLRSKYAVMEAIKCDARAPADTRWFPIGGYGSRFVIPPEDNTAITDVIVEMNSYRNNAAPPPFARPGWIEELFEWVQSQIEPLNLRLTGAIRQLTASPTFNLIRLETSGPAVWFKATGEPNLNELPVSVSLAHLFPGHVPRVLAVHPTWNAWLSEEAVGTPLDDQEEPRCWERVARALAQLQLDSIEKCPELLGNHCKDLRLSEIVERIEPFLAHMADLMAAQVKMPPQPLTNSNLALLGERLKDACLELQGLGLPDTLGHIDFNPGNIIISPTHCYFLDWAEGCISHPFVTFEYLREHSRRGFPRDSAAVDRVAAAYLDAWQPLVSPSVLKQAMAISPLVAVFVSAIADASWRSVDPLQEPTVAGYFRSLTRRMFREAAVIARRSEPCLR
jgi:hypothetical protein